MGKERTMEDISKDITETTIKLNELIHEGLDHSGFIIVNYKNDVDIRSFHKHSEELKYNYVPIKVLKCL